MRKKNLIQKCFIYGTGIVLIVLSSMVQYGWFTKNEFLIRVFPGYAAMVYNTSLSFGLMGIAFLFALTSWKWIPRLMCLCVLALNFLILMQYVYKINLYVDEFLFKYNLSKPMLYPGRSSFNTAVIFLLIGTSLFLITCKKRRSYVFIILSFGCVSMALSIANFFSYITGLESMLSWEIYSKMALHTAICRAVMSSSLVLYIVLEIVGNPSQNYTFPFAAGLAILVGVTVVWRLIYTKDFYTMRAKVQDEAEQVRIFVNEALREDILALDRFASRWEVLGEPPKEFWTVDAINYINDLYAVQSLEIINMNLDVVQQTGIVQTQKLTRTNKLQEAFASLKQNEMYFRYSSVDNLLIGYFPIFKNNALNAFLLATIDMTVMLERALSKMNLTYYRVVFLEDNAVILSKENTDSPSVGPPVELTLAEQFFPIQGEFYMTKSELKLGESKLNFIAYMAGIFMSLVTGYLAYLFISSRIKDAQLEITNKDLELARYKAKQATIAKSMFLSAISHEIRTPLNAVLGTIQILAETQLDDTQKRYLHRIDFSGRNLLNLINDLLDFSKIEANRITFEQFPFSLLETVQKVCEGFLSRSVEKKVPLIIEGPEQPLPNLVGDGHRLQQIISNLVSNAYKFTDHGEVVVQISYQQEGSSTAKVHIEVKDTGIGISQANQQKLFKKFSQVDASDARKSKGVGLGLSICKGLIEKMDGIIGVNSSEGQGASFWFELRFGIYKPEALPAPYNLENMSVLVLNTHNRQKDLIVKCLVAWKALVKTEYSDDFTGIGLVIISTDQKDLIQKVKEKNVPILYVENNNPEQMGEDLLVQPITSESLWNSIQKKRGK